MNEQPSKQLEQRIREMCKGETSVLAVCCWDVGMPRKGAWVVKPFFPKPNETAAQYSAREQEVKSYAETLQAAFNAKRGPYSSEEAALLIIAPECVDRELDYFVANAQGIRW